MAVPPRAMPPGQQGDDEDDFSFPTPPPPSSPRRQERKGDRRRAFRLPCSTSPYSSPPAWLLSSPIRRSFSAADCPASPWRARVLLGRRRGGCSPALSDYAGAGAIGFFDEEDDEEAEEEEERMDSLWEDLNDDDGRGDLFVASLDVSRRRSVAGPDAAERARRAAKERHDHDAPVLGASRSSRRRPPGLMVMMRALKRMFVAHTGKSKVHRDEQSTASASPPPPPPSSCTNPSKKR